MSTIKGGWKRAAIYDPATGDKVQFNRISTEFSVFNHPNITSETTVGLIYGGKDIELIIGILESDGLAQLESWMQSHTPVNAVVYGMQESVIFYEDRQLQFQRGVGVNARDGVSIHQAQLITVGADDIAYPLVNALAKNGVWTTGADSGQVIYPIEGATLTVAADYASISGDVDLIVTAENYAGASLEVVTVSASAGRVSAEITLPADTYAVQIDFEGNTGSATITNRSLRTDGKSEFING